MRRLLYAAIFLLFLSSCRTSRHVSDFQTSADTVSVSRILLTDSVSDIFRKSESASREWNIVWERTLYNSDADSCAPVREKQTLVLTSHTVSKRETMADNMSVNSAVYTRSDSSHVEMSRSESMEKEGIPLSRNIFWVFIVLLMAGVCARIFKF